MKKQGLIMSFGNTIPYAIVPLIFLINFDNSNGFLNFFSKGAVLSFAKDFISIFVIIIIIILKDPKKLYKIIKSKSGVYAMIAGIFGGPIGYTLYNTSFYLVGQSYGHIFSSLEPIFLVLLGIILLKRKFKWQLWLGICITIISISMLVFGESRSNIPIKNVLLGALLGVLGSLAWALEIILFDKAYQNTNNNFNGYDLLYAKMLSSILFSIIIMIPLTSAISGDALSGYRNFGKLFTNNNYLWRFLLAGILIVIARFLFFMSIKTEGGTTVGVIYNLTIILTPLFSLLYYAIFKEEISPNEPNLNVVYQISLWTTTPFIILGIILVTVYKPKIERGKNEKFKVSRSSTRN